MIDPQVQSENRVMRGDIRRAVRQHLNDDDDDLLCIVIPVVTAVMWYYEFEDREGLRDEVVRPRMSWDRHAEYLILEGQFSQYYRMTHASFELLLQKIAPKLQVDPLQSIRRTSGEESLTPAAKLQTCLSWLGGGSFHHLRVIAGMSRSSFYRCVYSVINAINASEDLIVRFPSTPSEIRAAAAGFASRSECGVFVGCIGAIDGWLCPIRTPPRTQCAKVDSFFSGHYQRYGLNVQACVDHNSRFIAFTVSNPGGTNDAVAFKRWALNRVLLNNPGPYYVVGDNAYTQSTCVMTPYNKIQLEGRPDRDSYNFYLSQLRIRVEMGFGLLVNKWRILKNDLQCKLSNCAPIISACIRLHNFCVDRRLDMENSAAEREIRRELRRINNDASREYAQTQSNPFDEFPDNPEIPREERATTLGEVARAHLVNEIASKNMRRPARNINRRRREESA